jgi:hypothetical protein
MPLGKKLSTFVESEKMPNEENRKNITNEEDFVKFASAIVQTLRSWNEQRKSRCDWVPTEKELRKLIYGGDPRRKEWPCYETMNLLGGDVTYQRVVQRAVLLMLEASSRRRIVNPFS